MLREQIVVLKVVYDDTESFAPASWDWQELIDEPLVEVMASGPDKKRRTEESSEEESSEQP